MPDRGWVNAAKMLEARAINWQGCTEEGGGKVVHNVTVFSCQDRPDRQGPRTV